MYTNPIDKQREKNESNEGDESSDEMYDSKVEAHTSSGL